MIDLPRGKSYHKYLYNLMFTMLSNGTWRSYHITIVILKVINETSLLELCKTDLWTACKQYFWDEYCSIQKTVRYLHPFWLHRMLSYKMSAHLQRSCFWLLVYESEIITEKKLFIPTKTDKEIIYRAKIRTLKCIYVWIDCLIWLFIISCIWFQYGEIMKIHNKVLSHIIIIDRYVVKILTSG